MVTFVVSDDAKNLDVYTAKVDECYLKALEKPKELVTDELLITHISFDTTAETLDAVMRYIVSCAFNMNIVKDVQQRLARRKKQRTSEAPGKSARRISMLSTTAPDPTISGQLE